jgi:hypothetical protein
VAVSDVTESNDEDVTQGYFGPVETQVRADVRALGALTGIRRSQAEIAFALARHLDSPEAGSPSSIARELTARLAELEMTATGREVSRADALVAEVADELAPRRRTVPPASA